EAPLIERAWAQLKAEAPSHVQPLMAALDSLERQFMGRKKLFFTEGEEGKIPVIHWLLADDVMELLKESSSADANVEAARRLIAARYLIPEDPEQRPWEFVWED